ncbi:MAG TPA: Uma2 family endonuclease [Tepidisphaeraceae bacterium]|jgi:Uma2 family endonuclease
MTIGTQRMTALEFLALSTDDVRSELVHGEIVMMASPNMDHGYAVTQLLLIVGGHVQTHNLGQLYSDIDTFFGPEDARRPDLLFFASNRLHLIATSNKPEVPPDLCIEVLSPSNAGYDRTDKFDLYQSASVPCYWIVDPMEQTLEAYKLEKNVYVRSGHGTGADILRLPPFEELEIPLARLWRPGANLQK